MNHQDYYYQSVDVLDYIKQLYPTCVDPDIKALHFCQNDDETWIETVYSREHTPFGAFEIRQVESLDFIVEDDESPAFSPELNIRENAYNFCHDTGVLGQAISIFIADPEENSVNDDETEESEDDEEEEEPDEAPNLRDNDEMMQIMNFLHDLFKAYLPTCEADERERMTDFQGYVYKALGQFMDGEEPQEFSFSLLDEWGKSKSWIDIATDGACITLNQEGYIYNEEFGGDSYTDWMFTIWSDGDEDGHFGLDIDTALEMIHSDAKINVAWPEEYMTEDEEDEDEPEED